MDKEFIRERIKKACTSSIYNPATSISTDNVNNSVHEEKQVKGRIKDMSIIGLLEGAPLHVTAYCRCDEEELPVQVASVELQKRFLEESIRRIPSWTCAGVFIDQCPKNTSLKKRPAFKAMVDNSGSYDLVLCQSISVLGRKLEGKNGIAAQLQELSKQGIYFFFQCERLYTGDASWKLSWMLLSSMARQECRWGKRNATMKIPPREANKKDGQRRRHSRAIRKPIEGE